MTDEAPKTWESWYYQKYSWAAIFAELAGSDKTHYDPDRLIQYYNTVVGALFSEIVRRMDKGKVERQLQKEREKAAKNQRRR